MKSNYSFETSKPAYLDNKENARERQLERVLGAVKAGADNLLQISEKTGILQATVSARVSDLIKEKKIEYHDFVNYKDRKRKKIQLYKRKPLVQISLF
jgi:hypothetical protein